ncbi:MAG: ferrous iron transport protein A, partial [Thermoflexales bacterium]|nr:ferrous iron transport protein A [Thermoflexales bacterium]
AVTVEMPSMFRDPVAYRVRGTLIALRREQADQVLIKDQTL